MTNTWASGEAALWLVGLALALCLGMIFGSFATVLLARVPRGEGITVKPSHCRECQIPIAWYHNIPVFSYLQLRGRCAGCQARIPVIYLVSEVATALLFALIFIRSGISWGSLAMASLATVTVPLFYIDLKEKRLPNALTFGATAVGVVSFVGAALFSREIASLPGQLVAAIIPALFLLSLALISRGGMGLGDVKLALALGFSLAIFGIQTVAAAMMLAFMLAGLSAIFLLVRGRAGMKTAIPLGPFLLIGAWLSFAVGNDLQSLLIWPWYH